MARYFDPLLRVAWSKLGERQAAEDIVQETFIAVYGSRDSFNPRFAFRTWVWTILLNLCRREMKKRSRRQQFEFVDQDVLAHYHPSTRVAHPETGLSKLLLQEQRQQVVHALHRLPEMQADAIRLRFYGELPFEEIAETMHCSVSGAKRRVKTGLLKLAELLQTSEENEA